MANRKYVRYSLVADFGQVNEQYENYREAYRSYCQERRHNNPATLYGFNEQGDVSVIFSHD